MNETNLTKGKVLLMTSILVFSLLASTLSTPPVGRSGKLVLAEGPYPLLKKDGESITVRAQAKNTGTEPIVVRISTSITDDADGTLAAGTSCLIPDPDSWSIGPGAYSQFVVVSSNIIDLGHFTVGHFYDVTVTLIDDSRGLTLDSKTIDKAIKIYSPTITGEVVQVTVE